MTASGRLFGGDARWDGARAKAELAWYTGRTARRIAKLPSGLYVFNFHRIGDARESRHDPNVFSCTQDGLEKHLESLKAAFDIIAPADLPDAMAKAPSGRLALVTFDDGYRDNFTHALPVLRSHRIRPLFFICTGFIDADQPPWWDQAAFMVRCSTVSGITLNGKNIRIRGRSTASAIREVLKEFKLIKAKASAKLELLKELLQPEEPGGTEQLFMSWDDLKSANEQGAVIGSHTLTHDKLAHLSLEEQQKELSRSKAVLDAALSQDTQHLAYPVGGYDSFTKSTMEMAQTAGYRFAFTTEQHPNAWSELDPLMLGRFSVSTNSPKLSQHLMLGHAARNGAPR